MGNELAVKQKAGMAAYLGTESVRQIIVSTVGEKDAQRFISSVVSAVQTNPSLAECTKSSIISAALVGHTLELPQSPQLQMFYLVPYDNKKKIVNPQTGREEETKVKEAVFMLSWRGYYQLALRSGKYQKIHVTDIREGEFISYDPIEDVFNFEPVLDLQKRNTLPVVGYYAFYRKHDGFEKGIYWSKEQVEEHAKRYSVTYRSKKDWVRDNSFWSKDFDAMAKKTLLRQLISKYGEMSVEMQRAYQADMAVISENNEPIYVDNVPDEPEKAIDIYEQENLIEPVIGET